MKALRNGLEAYSYEMRNNLDSYGSFEKYLDEATRKSFLEEINKVVDWIYGEGETAPKSEYRSRLDKFKAIGEPVRNRYNYYSELDVYFEQFDKLAANINEKLASIAHLSDEQRDLVIKKYQEAQNVMDKVKADRDAKKPYENPAFNLD